MTAVSADGKRYLVTPAGSPFPHSESNELQSIERTIREMQLGISDLTINDLMVALYFMYYNFARVHQTIRVTPTTEAGIADHV